MVKRNKPRALFLLHNRYKTINFKITKQIQICEVRQIREIKFRAWDNYHGEMVRVYAIALEKNCFKTDNYIYGSSPHFYDEHINSHLTEECELMQYTGIDDKNGKEIYEGDIVIAYNEECDFICKGQIVWDKWECGFSIKGEEPIFIGCYPELEVIGNIYENQELLGQTNQKLEG